MRHLRLTLGIAVSALTLLACDSGGVGGGRIDSNTNWLVLCEETAQCGDELVCECGVCTRLCDVQQDCGGDAVCAPDSSLPDVCASGGTAICVEECGPSRRCEAGFACVAGACTPTEETAAGPSTPTGDAGPADASDAGTDAADVADAGDDVTPDADAADTTDDAAIDADVTAPDTSPTDTSPDADATEPDVADATPDSTDAADTTPECDPAEGLVCSDGVTFPESRLLQCVDGAYQVIDICDLDCARHPREDDICLDECPAERPFCGQNEGLRSGVIYRCDPVTGLEIVENCEAQCDQGPDEPPSCR